MPSSGLGTNDRDKIDLDTGQPGHGGAPIQFGPRREGDAAEIILEEDELHTIADAQRARVNSRTDSDIADAA
jgi:hypothetical protein